MRCQFSLGCFAPLINAGDRSLAALIDRYPNAGVLIRLALQISVVGVGPRQHPWFEIVENELTQTSAHGEHRMTVAIRPARDRY